MLLPLLITGAAVAMSSFTSAPLPSTADYLRPSPPYRMWAFAYNATAGGPNCTMSKHRQWSCTQPPVPTATPVDTLYPPHTYNLLNPRGCYPLSTSEENSTTLLTRWLKRRGVACLAWESCWSHAKILPNASNTSVIEHFQSVIVGAADRGAVAIGLDECGDLAGPKWGHKPGEMPGEKKMALAAEGYRRAKKIRPHLWIAAWNPGFAAEPDGLFSGLMKDGTFDLAMFETCACSPASTILPPSSDLARAPAPAMPPADTHYAPYMIKPGGEFQDGSVSQWFGRLEFARKEGWLNRSIPCLGMLFGQSALNPTGWSHQQLRGAAEELKSKFPEMPGIGFYVSTVLVNASLGAVASGYHLLRAVRVASPAGLTARQSLQAARRVHGRRARQSDTGADQLREQACQGALARPTAPYSARDTKECSVTC
jgi:hypothetical protein